MERFVAKAEAHQVGLFPHLVLTAQEIAEVGRRNAQRRGRILDFPHQLGQIGERLCLFIELAFAGNRYQRASKLRGLTIVAQAS